ncbi:MAG: hypothetical protein K6C99_07045 [Lachnospiraceae bacterium]|nr:hypothetical protein [Lachnospiraceae bacterium]
MKEQLRILFRKRWLTNLIAFTLVILAINSALKYNRQNLFIGNAYGTEDGREVLYYHNSVYEKMGGEAETGALKNYRKILTGEMALTGNVAWWMYWMPSGMFNQIYVCEDSQQKPEYIYIMTLGKYENYKLVE